MRRDEYTEWTRDALLDAGLQLLTERGYAAMSIEEVSRLARVTRGAFYHHFAGKQNLFEAVFERLEEDHVARIRAAVGDIDDPCQRASAAIDTFLDTCGSVAFRRIVMQEGPAVLGTDRWRELDGRYTLGVLRDHLNELIRAGVIAEQPIGLLINVLFAALHEAAVFVAEAGGRAEAKEQATELLTRIMASLR
jgi:AcrR family transcriptional regulator